MARRPNPESSACATSFAYYRAIYSNPAPWQSLFPHPARSFLWRKYTSLKWVRSLSVFTAFQQCLDFAVIAQKGDEHIGWAVLKDKTQCKTAATLE
jgi:hypothetical protein